MALIHTVAALKGASAITLDQAKKAGSYASCGPISIPTPCRLL